MKGPLSFRNHAIPYSYDRNFQPQYYQQYYSPYQSNMPNYHQPNVPIHPYTPFQVNGMPQQVGPMFQQQGQGYSTNLTNQSYIFQNPLQTDQNYNNHTSNHNPYPNPYPKGNYNPKPKGGGNSLMNSFKSQDGSIDFNKMVNTAGQMMNAVNQVSSMVKGFGGIFKA